MTRIITILIITCTFIVTSMGQSSLNLKSIINSEIGNESDAIKYYFPKAQRIDANHCIGLDNFRNEWYSKHLESMKEPILFNQDNNYDVIRFTWLRSFDEAIMFRLENNNDTIKLIIKITDGLGGYDPGKIIKNETIFISSIDWWNLTSKIDSSNFWRTLPCSNIMGCIDGAQWILEYSKGEYYNFIDMDCPQSGELYEVCKEIIELSDIKIEKNRFY